MSGRRIPDGELLQGTSDSHLGLASIDLGIESAVTG